MKKLLLSLIIAIILINPNKIFAQLFWSGPANSWNSSNWSSTGSAPFTSPWVANSAAVFNVANSSITGATIAFSSITANENVTFTSISGTIGTGGTIANVNVASDKLFDFASQAISTAAGTGFVKDGAGSLALGGGSYTGGFTLNTGTVILRGVNAMGTGGTLIINGGTIAGSATRSLLGKYTSITVGGNFAFGSTVSPASSTANLTFDAIVNLGTNNRVITLNGTGSNTLSGVINSTGAGITTGTGSTGILILSGANTYTGPTTISGGTLTLGASNVIPDGSAITLNGGILRTGAFSETYSTVNLTENSTINLDASVQNHNFSSSNLISWTSGKTLTITGWTGGYNSTTGTGSKIFFGTSATGLTIQQLSQIKFFNGTVNSDAVQLSTGEVVPTGTLPITLTSFTGKEANKSIVLNWVTASEKNNKNFEILRSVDGKNFKSIGTVKGAGDSNTELKYSFVDANPFGGTNYYQLKQIDFDGKSSTFQIIPVDSKIAETQMTVYAANSSVNIGITSPNETSGKITLFDISGRKIIEQNISLNKGYNTLELNETLTPGVHFVTLENEGRVYRQKFIK